MLVFTLAAELYFARVHQHGPHQPPTFKQFFCPICLPHFHSHLVIWILTCTEKNLVSPCGGARPHFTVHRLLTAPPLPQQTLTRIIKHAATRRLAPRTSSVRCCHFSSCAHCVRKANRFINCLTSRPRKKTKSRQQQRANKNKN